MDSLLTYANEEILNARHILDNLELNAEQINIQNQQQKQTIKNLEVQVSQYQQQCQILLRDKLLQCIEIERLNDIIGQQQNGIDFYKQSIDAMQQEFEQKLIDTETEKQSLQSHLVLASAENDRLVKILFDKISEFQSKIKDFHSKQRLFESEVHKNIEILRQTYTQDKIQVKAIVENLLKERENFEQSKQEYEYQIQRLEEKLVGLETEKVEIFQENQEKAKQIEVLHKNVQSVYQEKTKEVEQIQIKLIDEKKTELQQQEKELKNVFEIEKNKALNNEKLLKQKILDLENQNQYLRIEIQRITDQFNDQSIEFENKKQQFEQQVEELENDREKILIEFEQYKQTYVISSDFEVTFSAEKTSYETIIMQLKQKLADCESQVSLLQNENKKINALTQDRMKQIELYRSKYGDNTVMQELDRLRNQLEQQNQQLVEYSEKNLKINSEKNSMQIQLSSCMAELNHKQEELDQQYELINIMKHQAGGSYQQADDYRKEVTELKKAITQLEGDLLMKNEGFANTQRQNEELKNQITSLKQQVQINEVEIHNNNQELIKKIKELDTIKAKYEDALINSAGCVENTYVSRISSTVTMHPSTKNQKLSYLQDIENIVHSRQQQVEVLSNNLK